MAFGSEMGANIIAQVEELKFDSKMCMSNLTTHVASCFLVLLEVGSSALNSREHFLKIYKSNQNAIK